MATVEEFIVGIGIDQKSVEVFTAAVEKAKEQAAANPVQISIETNDALFDDIASQFQQIRAEEEGAAEAAKQLADEEAAVAAASAAMAAEMEAAAAATVEAMQKADAAVAELQNGVIAAGVAAAGLTAVLAKASSEASGDEQAYAQLSIAFGDLTENAAAFSEALSKSTGRAVGEIQALLAETNLAVQAFGVADDKAVEFSKSLVEAAINLSAVTGQDAATIVQQFRNGLVLSDRALRQYGISLNEARVQAELLKKGLDPKTTDQATLAQTKLALILQDTAKFAGAASGANQTFRETMADLTAAIGETFGELGASVNEILKPFIEEIGVLVNSLKSWFQQNPALTKTIAGLAIALTAALASITLFAAAVAGITFIYKQYAALQAVIVGAQIAIAASTGTATAATIANTAAVTTNTAAVAAQTSAVTANAIAQSVVGKAATILNGIMKITNAQVLLNVKSWASLTATKVADWIYNGWTALAKFSSGLVTLTGHLLKGQIGLQTFVNMAGGELSPVLMQTVGATSALTTGVAALAVAYAGFKIGGVIEQWLGLADAQEKVMNGTAETSDVIKTRAVEGLMLVIGPLGWAALAWKKYWEAQDQAARAQPFEEIKKSVEALNPEQLLRFNELVKQGIVSWRALKIAIGDTAGQISEFQLLLGQKKSLNNEQLLQLESLYLSLSKTVPGFADQYAEAMGRVVSTNKTVALSFEQAKNVLKDTQKQYDEIKKKLEATEIKLNLGEDAAKSFQDLAEAGKAFDLFRQRAEAHKRVLEDLYKSPIGTKGITAEGVQTQIDATMKGLNEIKRLAEIAAREQTRLVEESFAKQAQVYQRGYEQEIKAAEERKNKIVDIERKKVDELQAEIEREMGIRKTANERAASFEKQLDQAALQRKDSTLAEIEALKASAEETLKDVSNQEVRERILAKVTARIKELSAAEDESKRIVAELVNLRKQEVKDLEALATAQNALRAAQVDEGAARSTEDRAAAAQKVKDATLAEADAAERLAETQKKIAEAEAARAKEAALVDERAKAAAAAQESLQTTSEEQAQAAADRDQKILDLENEKLHRLKAINDEERAFQVEVQKSYNEYEKKIAQLDRFRTKMEEIIKLQEKLTIQQATPGPEAKAEAYKTGGELAAQQAILNQLAKEQQAIAPEGANFEADVAAAVTSFKETIADARDKVTASAEAIATTEAEVVAAKTAVEASAVAMEGVKAQVDVSLSGLAAAMANLQPTSDALLAKTAEVETAIEPVPEAMDQALSAQDSLAESMSKLGDTTVDFARSMKDRWAQAGIRLDSIEAELSRLANSGEEATAGGY